MAVSTVHRGCYRLSGMALIEGIGDEVLQFFLVLFLLLIAVFAWWSTKISERPITVLVFERRQRRITLRQRQPAVDSPTTDAEDKPEEDAGTSEEAAENVVETATGNLINYSTWTRN